MLRFLNISFYFFLLTCSLLLYKLRLISASDYGKQLARYIERMGGIYVKIGQLLSVRPDIISFEVTTELYPLLQQLKPIPFEKIEAAIRQHTLKHNGLITSIIPEPLGTGSIAQVHKVLLHDGREAVVKVIKPGIYKYFYADLKMFRFFMKMGSYMPVIKKMPVRELAAEIDRLMRQQLNLVNEGKHLEEFRKNFEGNNEVIIPAWYKDISHPELIILEYIPPPLSHDFESWPAEKRTTTATHALRMLYQMMFKDGFTHCDMHPGNFFITPEGKFILLDFGMVTRMDDAFRNEFIKFFFYMSTNNGKGCADIILTTALHLSKRFDREKLYRETEAFINKFSSLPAEKFSVLAFTKGLVQLERQCGIKGATGFINNILAIAFFESHLKRIDPGIDFQEEAARYIMYNVPSVLDIIGEL